MGGDVDSAWQVGLIALTWAGAGLTVMLTLYLATEIIDWVRKMWL